MSRNDVGDGVASGGGAVIHKMSGSSLSIVSVFICYWWCDL